MKAGKLGTDLWTHMKGARTATQTKGFKDCADRVVDMTLNDNEIHKPTLDAEVGDEVILLERAAQSFNGRDASSFKARFLVEPSDLDETPLERKDPYDANRLLYVTRGNGDVTFTVERVRHIPNTEKPCGTQYWKGQSLAAFNTLAAKHVVNITQLPRSLTDAEMDIKAEKFRKDAAARDPPKDDDDDSSEDAAAPLTPNIVTSQGLLGASAGLLSEFLQDSPAGTLPLNVLILVPQPSTHPQN